MKEQFIVTRIIIEASMNKEVQQFKIINNNAPNQPPTFDTYKEAEGWIKENGEKSKFYQIQKFLMPI